MLAATFSGIFRSANGGVTWAARPAGELSLPTTSILFDPLHPGTVYAGTQGLGVFRSGDNGVTWAAVNTGLGQRSITSLLLDTANPAILYAGATDGVFRMTVSTSQWENLTLNLPQNAHVTQLARITGMSGVIAATDIGIYQLATPMQGQSWTLWIGQPTRLVTANSTGTLVHIASLSGTFQVTADGGATLFPATRGMQNVHVGSLAVTSVGAETVLYAGTTAGAYLTAPSFNSAGTATWSQMLNLGSAIFALSLDPSNQAGLLVGSEGLGVRKTADWGRNWSDASRGLVPSMVLAIDQDRSNQNNYYAGTSAGMFVSEDGGQTWKGKFQQQNQGPVATVVADPVAKDFVYYGMSDGRVFRSMDAGRTFFPVWTAPQGEGLALLKSAPYTQIYAVGTSGALYTSNDLALNFFRRGQDQISHRVLTVAADEMRPWIAYVGTLFGGVYKTESGAINWTQKNTGIDLPVIYSLTIDPANDAVLYAGSKGRIYKSLNGAGNWTSRTVGPADSPVTAIVVDPLDSRHILITVGPGGTNVATEGLYQSLDGGDSFSRLALPFQSSGALLLSRQQPGVQFSGSALRGLYRSSNGGVTWASSSTGMTPIVLTLAADPTTPGLLYAGSFSDGAFKSTDGGGNWSNIGLRDQVVFHLKVDPTNAQRLYAGTSEGVARSNNAGQGWSGAGQKVPFALAVCSDPRDPRIVFVAGASGQLYRSSDAGLTWVPANTGLPIVNLNALTIDPQDGTLFVALDLGGIYSSANGGGSWTRVSSGAIEAVQILALVFDESSGALFAGTNGGLYRSSNRGVNWQRVDQGFTSAFVNRVVVQPLSAGSSVVVASVLNDPSGSLANAASVYVSSDAGLSWVRGGSGLSPVGVTALAAAEVVGGPIYAATADGVHVSNNRGSSWSVAGAGLGAAQVESLLVDPANSNHVIAGTTSGIYQSLNGATTWAAASTPATFGPLAINSLASGAGGTSYAATTDHGIVFSRDGGASWTGGTELALTEMVVHQIAVNPSLPNVLYAALQTQGVARSDDSGTTWRLVNNGLGARLMFTVTVDPSNPELVYATSGDAGVWMSRNGGGSWSPLNDGLANLFVTAFAIDARDSSVLYAGTEGGGVYRFDP
ncbi:MAG TPA: hypothetical protein VIT67_23755 [Povalibacter sp.]